MRRNETCLSKESFEHRRVLKNLLLNWWVRPKVKNAIIWCMWQVVKVDELEEQLASKNKQIKALETTIWELAQERTDGKCYAKYVENEM